MAELRKKFRSNGFGYKARGSSAEIPDGIVMMKSYEAGPVVVTFNTKINREEFTRLKASGAIPSPADFAKLDAISIAEDGYARSEWGDRVYNFSNVPAIEHMPYETGPFHGPLKAALLRSTSPPNFSFDLKSQAPFELHRLGLPL